MERETALGFALEGSGWRLARSLSVLRVEANAVAPNRATYNDGTIGDAAHAARASRHNPYRGVVTALDLTHDPAHGFDCAELFEFLRAYPHPNLEYMIHNRKVARRRTGWKVERYTGSNPHSAHIHLAVGRGSDAVPFVNLSEVDNSDPWGLETWKGTDMTPDQDKWLKQLVVGNVARSYDVLIIQAKIEGNQAKAAELTVKRDAAVIAKKVELGLG